MMAQAYDRVVEVARRMNGLKSLKHEPIPITARELPEFAEAAVKRGFDSAIRPFVITPEWMAEQIRAGNFTLGGHRVDVI